MLRRWFLGRKVGVVRGDKSSRRNRGPLKSCARVFVRVRRGLGELGRFVLFECGYGCGVIKDRGGADGGGGGGELKGGCISERQRSCGCLSFYGGSQ